MNKKLIILFPLLTLFSGCAFDLSLGSFQPVAAPKSELMQARADITLAQEKIRSLEEQRRATLEDLEKARADIAMLQQRVMDLALATKIRESNDIPTP